MEMSTPRLSLVSNGPSTEATPSPSLLDEWMALGRQLAARDGDGLSIKLALDAASFAIGAGDYEPDEPLTRAEERQVVRWFVEQVGEAINRGGDSCERGCRSRRMHHIDAPCITDNDASDARWRSFYSEMKRGAEHYARVVVAGATRWGDGTSTLRELPTLSGDQLDRFAPWGATLYRADQDPEERLDIAARKFARCAALKANDCLSDAVHEYAFAISQKEEDFRLRSADRMGLIAWFAQRGLKRKRGAR